MEPFETEQKEWEYKRYKRETERTGTNSVSLYVVTFHFAPFRNKKMLPSFGCDLLILKLEFCSDPAIL